MIGTTREEINELNKIDLIDYLLKTDKANFYIRKNGTIVHKSNESLVIWNNHSYDFSTTVHPYKDAIGTLRILYNYDFMETINKLREYKKEKEEPEPKHMEISNYIKYDLFD